MSAMIGCWRFSLRGAGCGVRGASYGVRGTGCGVRGAGCGVRGTGCEVRGARYEVRGARALRLQSASTIGFKQLFSVLSVDDRNKLQVPGVL